jgi:hypothetical protein
VLSDSQEPDGLKVIDLGAGHGGPIDGGGHHGSDQLGMGGGMALPEHAVDFLARRRSKKCTETESEARICSVLYLGLGLPSRRDFAHISECGLRRYCDLGQDYLGRLEDRRNCSLKPY